MKGFQKKEGTNGIDIYKVKGWDYAGMCELFEAGIQKIRLTHIPALFHVEEVTQPQGHSTSGSHERYKSPERLEWERQWDGIKKMKEWVIENELISEEELDQIETEAKIFVRKCRHDAWDKYEAPIKNQLSRTMELIHSMGQFLSERAPELAKLADDLTANREPTRRDIMRTLHESIRIANDSPISYSTKQYYNELVKENSSLFNSHLYHEGPKNLLTVGEIKPVYAEDTPLVNGYEILNSYFDELFASNPKVLAFGEDVGKIGDVNQGFAGLQSKHGVHRIFDTGICELAIIGQGIGLAMRGLRPIAEIQYIDYILYALQTLSDDLATLQYRTGGKQSAPLIVRTRGHRLEGIWHSGSPMGMLIHSLRGLYLCVPRNMVQAAGMYNTLLKGVDPALVIECLNGYRLKEKLPSNLLDFTVPLGIPEIISEGDDITIVSYGSTLRIVQDAAQTLKENGVSCEIVDVQTLLPFDIHHRILDSLKKTSRILFVDEDVPGGATGYMFNKVIEEQRGFMWLDVAARTLSGKAHRPAYASDGDYFSKPNAEEIIDVVMDMMRE
jgi:pyruvate/2-oxoglutarate/acetoin dehydrogenase E1 component